MKTVYKEDSRSVLSPTRVRNWHRSFREELESLKNYLWPGQRHLVITNTLVNTVDKIIRAKRWRTIMDISGKRVWISALFMSSLLRNCIIGNCVHIGCCIIHKRLEVVSHRHCPCSIFSDIVIRTNSWSELRWWILEQSLPIRN